MMFKVALFIDRFLFTFEGFQFIAEIIEIVELGMEYEMIA